MVAGGERERRVCLEVVFNRGGNEAREGKREIWRAIVFEGFLKSFGVFFLRGEMTKMGLGF